MSIAACAPLPELISSYHLRPCGVASRAASPPMSCGKKPIPSEWSVTTRKSRGRESLARCPLEAITSSPLAKRYASFGPSRAPNAPASIEKEVWVCVSPKYGRVGKLRPAYGEYGGLVGKALSAASLSSVPMSVVAFCAATVVANTLAAQTAASAAPEMEDKRNIVNAPMILVHKRSGGAVARAHCQDRSEQSWPSSCANDCPPPPASFLRRLPLFVQHRSAIKQEGGHWFNAYARESEIARKSFCRTAAPL